MVQRRMADDHPTTSPEQAEAAPADPAPPAPTGRDDMPVTLPEWRRELSHRNESFGSPESYWCYVRPGVYRVGEWSKNQPSTPIVLPVFWMARFPVTMAQYAPFVQEGYRSGAERWWTLQGWKWKLESTATQPLIWTDSSFNHPDQPVVGVTWYEAVAFAAWLREHLAEGMPRGYGVRLPTEAEWEVAAAYDAAMQRRWYPWGNEPPTPEQAVYAEDKWEHPSPVGACPLGTAACGAQDMAGNVWEWTTSSYAGYPAQSNRQREDFVPGEWDVPVRGGSWLNEKPHIFCGSREGDFPDFGFGNTAIGFRVVVAPLPPPGS